MVSTLSDRGQRRGDELEGKSISGLYWTKAERQNSVFNGACMCRDMVCIMRRVGVGKRVFLGDSRLSNTAGERCWQ